eukprot:TRINITY_DN17739_c0_g2_i2.p1 TRINITY_DN17739_c0_g2~~TRINITY_DN17739_c0_g2_i2.p1  ORF type:complete len:192 (-),score=17.58 TRINITY_DN17739_c0_g2_i2:59-634(-)
MCIRDSCYSGTKALPTGEEAYVRTSTDCVYPFGVDPKWYLASNKLSFFNSLKMKLAIILGVTHMVLGIFLKAANTIYFKQFLDFWFEFIPQILFMLCTFGYMVVTIFIKWTISWPVQVDGKFYQPPSIISLFIDLVLGVGDASNNVLFDFENGGKLQTKVQMALLLVAIIQVPLMLFPKPILIYCLSLIHI